MSMSIDSMASMLNTTNTDATTNYNANALKKSLNGVSSDTSADELMQVCKDFESYFVEEVIKEVKKNLLPDDEEKDASLNLLLLQIYQCGNDRLILVIYFWSFFRFLHNLFL